MQKISSLSV
jgi:hypothetical protein